MWPLEKNKEGISLGRRLRPCFQMRRVDDRGAERAAETIMHALGHLHVLGRLVEIELPGVVPVTHDGKPIEHRYLALSRHPTHTVRIGADRNNGFGTRAVLHVHKDDVGSTLLQLFDAVRNRSAEFFWISATHRVVGTSLPYHQTRFLVDK